MADNLSIKLRNQKLIFDSLQKIKDKTSLDYPAIKQALTRAGILLVAQIKLNIRKNRIIDSGRLLNSIKYEIMKDPTDNTVYLQVGSWGVPYSAMHEFGGVFTPAMRRAMFATLRDAGKLGRGYKRKSVIMGNRFRARPYVRPAYEQHKSRIVEYIQQAMENV